MHASSLSRCKHLRELITSEPTVRDSGSQSAKEKEPGTRPDSFSLAPEAGLEPATIALTGRCSTIELLRITFSGLFTIDSPAGGSPEYSVITKGL